MSPSGCVSWEDDEELNSCLSKADEQRAMEFLRRWIYVEKAMEDTIDVLEQEGWVL